MYVQREAQKALARLMRQFKVVLVTGARQVGKSTMVQEVLADRFAYVSLDDARLRELAHNDPALFMKDHVPPVVIDEAQKAPNLFDAVKLLVDARPDKGKIVLTGSQTYRLMHGVSETLAGRIAVLRLSGLSLRERLGLAGRAPYVPGKNEGTGTDKTSFDVWTAIWRGDMPALLDPDIDWDDFYTHYTATYVERDVRELIQVANEERFYRFLISCAARTGAVLNVSELARDVGVEVKTCNHWLSILKASGMVHLLRPYAANAGKRAIKSPKLYFMDTGLVCYLLGWTSPRVARDGAMSGALFETFVVAEILKSYFNDGRNANNVFFYRDERKREIDLVIRDGMTLHPVEIKKGASPQAADVRAFSVLEGMENTQVGAGAVICQTERAYSLRENVRAVPLTEI